MRKLSLLAASALLSLSSVGFAGQTIMLAPAVTKKYDLKAHDTTTISNPLFWSVTVNCSIDKTASLTATVLKKSGRINGKKMSKGESMTMLVHPGEKFEIKADGGAKVSMLNHEDYAVKAQCKT